MNMVLALLVGGALGSAAGVAVRGTRAWVLPVTKHIACLPAYPISGACPPGADVLSQRHSPVALPSSIERPLQPFDRPDKTARSCDEPARSHLLPPPPLRLPVLTFPRRCRTCVQLGCTFMDRVLKIEPKNYLAAVDISADDNDAIPMPKTAGQPVRWG